MLDRLMEAGMHPNTAQRFVEMNASMHSGKLYEDYNRNISGSQTPEDGVRYVTPDSEGPTGKFFNKDGEVPW